MAAKVQCNFKCMQGNVNIARGFSLHEDVFTEQEEKEFVDWILARFAEGRRGAIRPPTFLKAKGERSRGNKREALQYGGFFDFNKAGPGDPTLVPPMPAPVVKLYKILQNKGVIDFVPGQTIINHYQKGDCIPPHTDHESYPRPIVSISFMTGQRVLIGTQFRSQGSGMFTTTGIDVVAPPRSVFVLDKESANIAKHCIPACTGERVSVTFRMNPHPEVLQRVFQQRREKAAAEKQNVSADGLTAKQLRAQKHAALLAKHQRKKAAKAKQLEDIIASADTVLAAVGNSTGALAESKGGDNDANTVPDKHHGKKRKRNKKTPQREGDSRSPNDSGKGNKKKSKKDRATKELHGNKTSV